MHVLEYLPRTCKIDDDGIFGQQKRDRDAPDGIATHDPGVGAHDIGSYSMGIPDISWAPGGAGGAAA